MATNKTDLFSNVNGSKWNTGVVFERTNPGPIEKYSVFQTLADAQTYASTNAVAYPGQIITVIGGEQEYTSWSFSDSGTHTVTFDKTWKIDGTDTENSNTAALSITAGSITATRTITKPYSIAVYKIIDTAGTLKQIDASITPTDLPIATTTTLGAIKVGEGLGIAADGTLSAQKLTVDQKVEGNETSENPASTKAVYDWSLSTLDSAATTAQSKVTALETALKETYLPNTYLKSEYVQAGASTADKVLLSSTVDTKIKNAVEALDVGELTLNTWNGQNFETISSIQEVDGKIIVKKATNSLKTDVIDKIAGLQEISASTDKKINDLSTSLSNRVDEISSSLYDKIEKDVKDLSTSLSNRVDEISSSLYDKIEKDVKDLSTSLSTAVDTKIKDIKDNYALSADVSTISTGLFDKIVADSTAAQKAGEVSAQAVRNTYELCAVKYDDVKGGKSAITTSNKIVTQQDIAALTGVMHFVGTTTDENLVDGYKGKPSGIAQYDTKDPIQGDFVIRTDTAKEFVYVGEWNTGSWNEIGDEDLYAKKSELSALSGRVDTHISDTTVHITAAERTAWNAKATSSEVSVIADAYRAKEETRATGVEGSLRADINEISGQVSSFTNTWKNAVDLSVSNLSAYAKNLSTELGNEAEARKVDDLFLSGKISSIIRDYALSTDVTTISGNLFDKIVAEETARKADSSFLSGKIDALSNEVSAISSAINGEIAAEVAARAAADSFLSGKISTVSSDLDTLEGKAVLSVKINGQWFTVDKNIAEINISQISCGGADSE